MNIIDNMIDDKMDDMMDSKMDDIMRYELILCISRNLFY